MKNTILLIILFVNFLFGYSQSNKLKTIGLINPTPRNIEKIIFLKEAGLLKIDSLKLIGVCHASQKELIKETSQIIEHNNYKNISLYILDCNFCIDSLFYENQCTKQFYELFSKTDGLIFPGGADISPKIYGEKTFLTTNLIKFEKNWELSFLYHLIGRSQNKKVKPFLEERPDYLILGICLGMQEMNVANGGTLYQDIPFQIYDLTNYEDIMNHKQAKQHKNLWGKVQNWDNDISYLSFHPISIPANSSFKRESFSGYPLVASIHHQSIKKVGLDYKESAYSLDNEVVEAFEHKKYKNVYGVQFHPELPVLYNNELEFKISPNGTVKLDQESILFHKYFWKDFSQRLSTQH